MFEKDTILASLITKQAYLFDKTLSSNKIKANVVIPKDIKSNTELQYQVQIQETNSIVKFSSLALSQLLSKIGISAGFYNKCPPWLQQDIFNYFIGLDPDLQFFIRFAPNSVFQDILQEDYAIPVRAVLSTGYHCIDDHELIPKVITSLEELENPKNLRFLNCTWSDQITRMLVLFEDCKTIYNNQEYFAGISIVNSEVGQSSVWIEPIVFNNSYVIYNRASLQKQQVNCRVVHRGAQTFDKLNEMISQAKRIAQVGLVQFIESTHEMISKEHALQFVKTIDVLPSRFQLLLEDEWQNELELSRAQVTIKILKAAQELPLFQRVMIEQQAGKITKLFDNFESRMKAILDDIENS